MRSLATNVTRRHRIFPVKGTLSEINTGSPVFYVKHHMDGSKEAIYHVNLIDLLDRVFVLDGLRFLSIEQERFVSRFINQAGTATNAIKSGTTNPFSNMDEVYKQLDDFLGSYLGVDNGRYTR